MSYAVFYTIGNSDITYYDEQRKDFNRISNKESKKSFIDNFRKITENSLNTNYRVDENRLLFKDPVFFDNLKFHSAGFTIFDALYQAIDNEIDIIYLFCTDQTPPHKQDTIHLARLMEKYISSRYGTKCVVNKIIGDPSNYVEMENYFRNFIEKNTEIENYQKIYFQLTAGTPAMYVNLALNLINFNTGIYYVKREGDLSKAIEIKQNYQLHKKFLHDRILKNLNTLNYSSAMGICNNSLYKNNKTVSVLLETGENLINNNYTGVKLSELSVADIDGKTVAFLNELSRKISNTWDKLKIILDRIEYCNKSGKYLESLVLLVGLGENIFKQLLADHSATLGLNYTTEEIKESSKLVKLVRNDSDLVRAIERNKYASKKDLAAVLDNIVRNNERIEKFLVINDKYLKKISEIRDKSPYAHGLEGIDNNDRENIDKAYDALKNFFEPQDNIFEKLNSLIMENLQTPG